MYFNLTLPDFNGLSDESSLQQIKGYLSILNEQLRYMMLNIDEDNLSSSLSDTIGVASESASIAKEGIGSLDKSINALDESILNINQKMTSFGENISSISKKADKIALIISIGNNDDENDITLTEKAKELVKNAVDTDSFLTSSDLEEKGGSVINGENVVDSSLPVCKLTPDENGNLDLTAFEGGTTVCKQITLKDGESKRHLSLSETGSLIFDTGVGELPFSFGITTDESGSFFSLFDKDGKKIGSLLISQSQSEEQAPTPEPEPEPEQPEADTE